MPWGVSALERQGRTIPAATATTTTAGAATTTTGAAAAVTVRVVRVDIKNQSSTLKRSSLYRIQQNIEQVHSNGISTRTENRINSMAIN